MTELLSDLRNGARSDVADALGARTPPRVGKWRRWRVVGIATVTLIVGVVAVSLKARSEPMRFETQEVRRDSLAITVTATGNLQPTNEVDVGIEVSGTVAEVLVDHNDAVKRGEVLAMLDPTKFKARVMAARAALASARSRLLQTEATVQESRTHLTRLTRLHEATHGSDPSQLDIDAADAALKRAHADQASARAAIAEAKAALESDEADLAKTVIRSPVDGVVLARTVEPGQTVAASLQTPVLFVLAEDLKRMELHVSVDEADVGRVRSGEPATFTVDAYAGRTFSARISKVHYGAQEVDGVVTYRAVLNVDNEDLSLRPGMTGTASIVVEEIEDALTIPNAALRFSPPEASKGKSKGGLVGLILPRPPRTKSMERFASEEGQQTVWTIRDGQPTGIGVQAGLTDGVRTEVLEGDVAPGMPLLVGVRGSDSP